MQTRAISVAAAVVVILVSIGFLVPNSTASEGRWQWMEAWAERAEAQWEQRDFEREPLHGAAEEGSAFEAYAIAIEQLPGSGALEALSRGAHRRDARRPIDWSSGFEQAALGLLEIRDLANAAVTEAHRLMDDGRGRAAVELTLDGATLGADLLHSPFLIEQMIGCAVLGIVCDEAWPDERLARLNPDALELFAEGMAALDDRCPARFDSRGELLILANTLQELSATNQQRGASLHSLFGMDSGAKELAIASEAIFLGQSLWVRLDSMRDNSWPARETWIKEQMNSEEMRTNPVIQVTMPKWAQVEQALRFNLTKLRLLRVAIAHRREGPTLRLDDPLGGGPLMMELSSDGALEVSSVGSPGGAPLKRYVGAR